MARRKFDITKHDFKNGKLEHDNIFVNPKLESVTTITGMDVRPGMENFLTVDKQAGKPEAGRLIINNVSDKYGFLSNEAFYPQVEERLDAAGITYKKRTINRNNRSFTVDYILDDESMHVNIKNGQDKIKPLIRVLNSYDGSAKTSGSFGFFRQICSNGLHIADTQLKFEIRHRGDMFKIVMPKVEDMLAAFMDNEYYSIHKKFQVLSEKPLSDIEGFVKYTLGKSGLFKYEKSEANPEEPSAGAQFVIDIINAEAKQLGTAPNLWLGYNAFNEYIHTQNNRAFMLQERADRMLFDAVMAQIN